MLETAAQEFDCQAAYNRLVPVVEGRYGIEVVISDVVDPNTGDFDGQRILTDYDRDLEVAVFVLIHPFGHTVQWNVSERYRALGLNATTAATSEEMPAITAYEQGATRPGIAGASEPQFLTTRLSRKIEFTNEPPLHA